MKHFFISLVAVLVTAMIATSAFCQGMGPYNIKSDGTGVMRGSGSFVGTATLNGFSQNRVFHNPVLLLHIIGTGYDVTVVFDQVTGVNYTAPANQSGGNNDPLGVLTLNPDYAYDTNTGHVFGASGTVTFDAVTSTLTPNYIEFSAKSINLSIDRGGDGGMCTFTSMVMTALGIPNE